MSARQPVLDDPRSDDPIHEKVVERAVRSRLFAVRRTPLHIGRFALLERVGAGAMGTVWAAYDPELDRRVALKMLHATTDARAGERVQREARAMATVNHPNVAHVYEVGEHDQQTFIAMEYVRGTTLRQWWDAGRRPWSEIVERVVQAARGLAAAHRAGVVHRDFKPDNVLVGEDARVRVVDFGLAQLGSVGDTTQDEPSGPGSSGVQTRPRAGTPAYMAPEQYRGEDLGPAADQFALCVALLEGLVGRRPFGDVPPGAKERLDVQAALADLPARVPKRVRRAIVRGLAHDASRRFASMDDLVAVLSRPPRRRRDLAAVTVAVGAIAVSFGLAARTQTGTEQDPCPDPSGNMAGVWDDDVRASVQRSLLSSAPGLGAATWPGVAARLDEYAAAWVAGRTDACEATYVRHAQSEALLDARMQCLDDRRRGLEALTTTLREQDTGVDQALAAVTHLPPVDRCADPAYVQALHPLPDDIARAQKIQREMARLSRARALHAVGRFAEAREVADDVATRAVALSYPPLSTKTELTVGLAAAGTGDLGVAQPSLRAAYVHGRGERVPDVTANAAATLSFVLARHAGEAEAAKAWARVAEAEAIAASDRPMQAAARNAYGIAASIHAEHDQFEEADEAFREAIALSADDPATPDALSFRGNYGRFLHIAGKLDEAASLLMEVARDGESAMGEGHPTVINYVAALADVLLVLQRPQEAEEHLRRAIPVAERTRGAEHPDTIHLQGMLGKALASQGKLEPARVILEHVDELLSRSSTRKTRSYAIELLAEVHRELDQPRKAAAYFRRAIEILDEVQGPRDRDGGRARGELARTLISLGELDEAAELAELAVARYVDVAGPEHIETSEAYKVRGDVALARGDLAGARRDLQRAYDIRAAHVGADAEIMWTVLESLAELELKASKPGLALAFADRALAAVSLGEGRGAQAEGAVHFVVARARLAAGRPRAQVQESVARAVDLLDGGTPRAASTRAKVQTWARGNSIPTSRPG